MKYSIPPLVTAIALNACALASVFAESGIRVSVTEGKLPSNESFHIISLPNPVGMRPEKAAPPISNTRSGIHSTLKIKADKGPSLPVNEGDMNKRDDKKENSGRESHSINDHQGLQIGSDAKTPVTPEISATHATPTPPIPADRPERPEPINKPERLDRPERPDLPERPNLPERPEKPQRPERPR